MTTTAKKRLSSITALLVTMMILIGIMPNDILDGVFKGTTVQAAFDINASYRYYFDVGKGAAWGSAWLYDGSSWHLMEQVSGDIYGYSTNTAAGNDSYFAKTQYDTNLNRTQPNNGLSSGNKVYYATTNTGNWVTDQTVRGLASDSYSEAPADPRDGTRSMLVGVNYFNYFYDEQVVYGANGKNGTSANPNITQGQVKSPYVYFNRAVMNSNYGKGSSSYPVMYAGEFWIGGVAESGGTQDGGTYNETTPIQYVSAGNYDRNNGVTRGDLNWGTLSITAANNKNLKDFYWGANLAHRYHEEQKYYHVVAQGLVDSDLPSDLVPTKGGNKIPYFDAAFLTSTSNASAAGATVNGGNGAVGEVYTSTFPLYRSTLDLTAKNTTTLSGAWNDSTFKGMSLTSTQNITGIPCYKFNSATDVVRINKENGMSETTGAVYDVEDQQGFFPFNNSGASKTALEYGFGVRLDIKFNIGKDGYTKDASGNFTGSSGTDAKPMIFRFIGDDDVWVFIDNKLVLDMGGGHKNAIGEINFSNSTAAVLYAGDADATDVYDNSVGTLVKENSSVTTLLSNIQSEATNNSNGVSEEHTLTMFYMERGKLNSNMALWFNFVSPSVIDLDDNFPADDTEVQQEIAKAAQNVTTNTFKVREETNFDNVNPGLLSQTKFAAEDDVFAYNVKSNSVLSKASGTAYPTSATNMTRTSDGKGSSGEALNTTITNSTHTAENKVVYLDISQFNGVDGWYGSSGRNQYLVYWTDANDKKILGPGTLVSANVYKFTFPSDYSSLTSCDIVFMCSDGGLTINGAKTWVNGTIKYRTDLLNGSSSTYGRLSNECICRLNGTVNSGSGHDGGQTYEVLDYEELFANTNNSALKNVSGTQYTLREAYSNPASKIDKTDSNGNFKLMYGTSGDESSAKFVNQLTEPNYSFNVTQGTVAQTLGTSRTLSGTVDGRTVSEFYTTEITIEQDVGVSASSSNPADVTVSSNTTGNRQIGASVKNVTVTFENTVKVGSIQITKNALAYYNGDTDMQTEEPGIYNDTFWFMVTFSNIFGKSGNNANATSYGGVRYVVDGAVKYMENATVNGTLCGLVKLQQGETAVIDGIPEGTLCYVNEVHQSTTYAAADWAQIYNTNDANRNPTETVANLVNHQCTIDHEGAHVTLATYAATNMVRNRVVPVTNISLKIQKRWMNAPSDYTKTSVQFIVLRSTSDTSDETAWTPCNYDGNHANGIITLPANQNSNLWEATLANIPQDDGLGNTYYYRIIEYDKDRHSLIYTSGGYYDAECVATYEESGVATNKKATTAAVNDELTLTISNSYRQVQGMPKTGAAGVVAVITFGAFAITIAGVALLIYRKKLQAVNINAVKGRFVDKK